MKNRKRSTLGENGGIGNVKASSRSSAVSPLVLTLQGGAVVVTYWKLYKTRKVRKFVNSNPAAVSF